MIWSEERALFRADLYRILAVAFSYPSPERFRYLSEIVRDLTGESKPEGADEGGWNALSELGNALQRESRDSLEGEYNRLFSSEVAVSPCESSYGLADKGGVLSDAGGFYRAFGLDAGRAKEPPDSIGHQLEFMSILVLKEIYGEENRLDDEVRITREAQAAFLRDHLGRWFRAFASRLKEMTNDPFYLSAGELLEQWIGSELKGLGVEPIPLSPLQAAEEGDQPHRPAGGPA